MFRIIKIKPHQRGLLFRDGSPVALLRPGWHVLPDPLLQLRIEKMSPRDPWIRHADLDLLVKSGILGGEAIVVDLRDHERALVWIDGRFSYLLEKGLFAFWTAEHDVKVEIVDARPMKVTHAELPVLTRVSNAAALLEVVNVEASSVGLWFRDGVYQETLAPGTYAFWRGEGRFNVQHVDMKEITLDISGQEIMTADKVTLRINAVLAYRVIDPLRSVTEVDAAGQALYRSAQLALRESVGAKDLDTLLAGKGQLAAEVTQTVAARAVELGLAIVTTGIRDVILPGEMKELMNKVTEAKKGAEAALVTRREETAAMRMQANTAKILESSPTLMKLKELEVLEKVAAKANLTVVLGEDGLANRVVKLL